MSKVDYDVVGPELYSALKAILDCELVECGEHGDGPCCVLCGGLQTYRRGAHGIYLDIDHDSDCPIHAAKAAVAKVDEVKAKSE